MFTSTLVEMLAGIGLFLAGLSVFGSAMKKLGGTRFRGMVTALTRHDLRAFGGGLAFGVLASSAKAVLFACAGFVSASLLPVRKVLPVLFGGSVGSSAIILWGSLDLGRLELAILGLTGFLLHFGSARRGAVRQAAEILLGFGLLLFGLAMLKEAARGVADAGWLEGWSSPSSTRFWAAIPLGLVLGFIFQSAIAVALMLIALSASGILAPLDAAAALLAANLGAAWATLPLAAGLRGEAKQVAAWFAVFKTYGSLVTLTAVIAVRHAGWSPPQDHQGLFLGLLFLSSEVAGILAVLMTWVPLTGLVKRLCPPSEEESLGRPQFLDPCNFLDPASALDLVALEQARLLERAPRYFDPFREGIAPDQRIARGPDALHAANLNLSSLINRHLADLRNQESGNAQKRRIIHLHEVQRESLTLLHELNELTGLLSRLPTGGGLPPLFSATVEGLHAIVEETVVTVRSGDDLDLATVLELTSESGTTMDGIKKNLLDCPTGDPRHHQDGLDLLVRADRVLTSLNRLALILRRQSSTTPHAGEPGS